MHIIIDSSYISVRIDNIATPDLTPLEQQKDKALRQKLAEMNKDDKMYKIKMGR